MKFRENLKAELAYKAMLVKELATFSGVNKRTIDNYLRENGSIPTADTAVAIARVLGVSVEYLITGNEIRRDNSLSALPPDMRLIMKQLEELDDGDRKVVLNLITSLKERETTHDGHKRPVE
ncbi:transcriptional regulator [Spirochaetia bacterium]|nr:transcriptional regulator [Spirochaetia bacterium]